MKVISQVIDIDKEHKSEDLLSTVQAKLAEMSQNGTLDASPLQAKASAAANESADSWR